MTTTTYRDILDRLRADIAEGVFKPGQFVPSQRTAARAWGVSTATVTRAYNEAIRLGLLAPVAGKGTCVASDAHPRLPELVSEAGLNNLAVNAPAAPRHLNAAALLRDSFTRLADGRADLFLKRHQQTAEAPEHVEQAASWLRSMGVPAGETFITPGAQAALLVALRTVASGGAVACESLTNPGLVAAANFVGARLVPLRCDDAGPDPAALEAAVERHGLRAIHASPTCSNPLALHWSDQRRRDIAAIVERHRLWILEDDDQFPLDQGATPLCALAPERTILVLGLSKIAGFALRTGFARVPQALANDYRYFLRASVWMASPILADVAAQWLASGAMQHWIEARRTEAIEHQALARRWLGRHGYRAHELGLHGWLPLRRPWDAERFAHFARCHGVAVAPGSEFLPGHGTGRNAPSGVRLSLSSTSTTGELAGALRALGRLLADGPQAGHAAPSSMSAPR